MDHDGNYIQQEFLKAFKDYRMIALHHKKYWYHFIRFQLVYFPFIILSYIYNSILKN